MNTLNIPKDIFGREKMAQSMCEWLVRLPAERYSPFALVGPWGCGKTVHAMRIMNCLQNQYKEKVKCIYWNAANSDYSENPLLQFISALYQYIPDSKLKGKGAEAVALCSRVLLGALGGVASIGEQVLANQLGFSIKQTIQEFKDTAIKCNVESQFEMLLKNAAEDSQRVMSAKELMELIQEDGKELIIIIDELDRCRPDFALKILEAIKHLFTFSGCKFLLVLNKDALGASVKHLYGIDDESAVRYLNKYINFNLYISRSSLKQNSSDSVLSQQYFWSLLYDEGVTGWSSNIYITDFLDVAFRKNNIELREVEKLVDTIRFMMFSSNKGSVVCPFILCFVAYLFAFEQDIYDSLFLGNANVEFIMSKIGVDFEKYSERQPAYATFLRCLLNLYITHPTKREDKMNIYSKKLDPGALSDSLESLQYWLGRCSYVRG